MVPGRRGEAPGGGALWVSGRRPRDRAQGGSGRPDRAGAGARAPRSAGPDAGTRHSACSAGGAAHRARAGARRTRACRTASRRQLRERCQRRSAARDGEGGRRTAAGRHRAGRPGAQYGRLPAAQGGHRRYRHRRGSRSRAGGGAGADGRSHRPHGRRRDSGQHSGAGPWPRARGTNVDGDPRRAAGAAMAGDAAGTFAGGRPCFPHLCSAPRPRRRNCRRRPGHERNRHGQRRQPYEDPGTAHGTAQQGRAGQGLDRRQGHLAGALPTGDDGRDPRRRGGRAGGTAGRRNHRHRRRQSAARRPAGPGRRRRSRRPRDEWQRRQRRRRRQRHRCDRAGGSTAEVPGVAFQPVCGGPALSAGDAVPAAGDRDRRHHGFHAARPARGPGLHLPRDGDPHDLAWRDHRAGRPAGHGPPREEAAGGAVLQVDAQLFQARRVADRARAAGHRAPAGGRGDLVPGAQEGGRHPPHAAAGDRRPVLQRRVRRRLRHHLRLHRRRLHDGPAEGPDRSDPPGTAAGSRRRQG